MMKTSISATVRWPADLKAEIERLAEADGRSFSNYVIQVLRQHIATIAHKQRKQAK